MINFVEFQKRAYNHGRYISTNLLVSLDDISRVVQCEDDCTLANLVTKDGKIHTLNESYGDAATKIENAIAERKEMFWGVKREDR